MHMLGGPLRKKSGTGKELPVLTEYIAYLFVASLMDEFIVKTPEEKAKSNQFY